MRDAYIDCLDPRALQWKLFTIFVERENYKTWIIFLDVLILISRREKERKCKCCKQNSAPKCYIVLNLKQLKLELWRVCSFNWSETVALSEKANKGGVVEDNMIEGIFCFICFCCSFTLLRASFALFAFVVASHAWLVRWDFSGDNNMEKGPWKGKNWVKRHVCSHLCPGDHPEK